MLEVISGSDSQLAMTVYPAVGYPATDEPGGHWRVSFSGIAWRRPVTVNRRQQLMIRMLGNVMRATPEQLRSEVFESRIHPFMAGAFKKLPVAIGVAGQTFPLRKPTRRNGRFSEAMLIPGEAIQHALDSGKSNCVNGISTVPFEIISRIDDRSISHGQIFLIPRRGVSIISDIDDTIKDSQVGDRRELLANTFLREFRSIEGMADVYQQWAAQGAAFHYVSSSPWQLFEALTAINTQLEFPIGTMHLRDFRLRDQLLNRFMFRRNGKASVIRHLVESMPDREFILIGDSGEKDPRIYRKVCRRFPGQVRGVFIRSVAHRPFQEIHTSKLAQSLPQGVVAGFDSASELMDTAGELIET